MSKRSYVKIGVAGLQGTGKSAFIQSVSEFATESWGRITIGSPAEDHLQIRLQEIPPDKPDQWEIYMEGLLGIVVLIDSTQQDTFPTAATLISAIRQKFERPMVFAANKQDLANAISPEYVSNGIGEQGVIGCVATDQASSQAVLKTLLYVILDEEA